MNRWMINIAYLVVSTGISVGIAIGALMLWFVNPINWKNYVDFATVDWIWLTVSNGVILIVALALIAGTWIGLWKLKQHMANQASQPIAAGAAQAER